MRIRDLHLSAADTSRLADFYAGVLGLPRAAPSADDREVVAFQVGATRLTFHGRPADTVSPYHFAFNITPRKFAEAKSWLSGRVSLLRNGDSDDFDFASWNAHAVYFRDPAGNVAELIARHDLPDDAPGPFGPSDFLGVSEIGVVVPEVPAFVDAVQDRLGLAAYRPGSEVFAPIGDEHGLLIVVREGRPWFPTDSQARIQPIEMVVEAPSAGRFDVPKLGLAITSVGPEPSA